MGRAFGLHKAMDSTGAVMGPLLVIPILLAASSVATDSPHGLPALHPAILAVVVILLRVREANAAPHRPAGHFAEDARRLGRRFWSLTLVVLVFYAGEISYAFFVLQSEAQGMSAITTILLYVLFNGLFVVVSLPSGIMSDRFGRRPVLSLSFLLFAAACMVMSMADGLLLLVLGFSLFGVYKGSSEGVFKAFVVDMVPRDLRGTALGIYHTAVGLVMLPGGIIAGLLWDSAGAS